MALKIVWTPRAEKGYEKIITYLKENWTEREVRNFVRKSRKFFELLSRHPDILEKTGKQKNVYRGPMDDIPVQNDFWRISNKSRYIPGLSSFFSPGKKRTKKPRGCSRLTCGPSPPKADGGSSPAGANGLEILLERRHRIRSLFF